MGGPTALIKDFDDRVAETQPLVFGFVALIAFVMLLISIRSVFLALKGVLMTVLSVAAAYGSLVVVFQWGWLADLGFKQISSLDSTIPPLVLALTFGLSMDYEIFLLTRIRERFLQSGNTRDAVAYGVSTSARTITSAALIMIAVFIGFAFAGMPLVAQLGVACAVAIAVDATVVRLVLVPALMAMFDEWNWWLPRWLDRILPSVDFVGPDEGKHLAASAARLVGMHTFDDVAALLGGVAPGPAGFKTAMLRLARDKGTTRFSTSRSIRQTTWKLMADRPSLSPAVFDAWNELWVGAALAHDRFIRLEVTQRRDRGDEFWEWRIG